MENIQNTLELSPFYEILTQEEVNELERVILAELGEKEINNQERFCISFPRES